MHLEYKSDFLAIKTKEAKIRLAAKTCQINDFEINMPGEYEVSGVHVRAFEDQFLLTAEGINLIYFNGYKNNLSESEADEASRADVTIFALSENGDTVKKEISSLLSKIDPRMVIFISADQALCELFIKEYSAENIDELKISVADLPLEGRKSVVLSCQKSA